MASGLYLCMLRFVSNLPNCVKMFGRSSIKNNMRIMIDTNIMVSAALFPQSSGDKDFSCVECERPEIMTPTAFVEKYMSK